MYMPLYRPVPEANPLPDDHHQPSAELTHLSAQPAPVSPDHDEVIKHLQDELAHERQQSLEHQQAMQKLSEDNASLSDQLTTLKSQQPGRQDVMPLSH